ncbi:hypothetical protein [Mesorhizobium sp. M0520]|uniref:hypothetical protein n=1 Tax=Mesorhizobium sp. M0520 TaxID=2956957 RepID=UPI00333AD499
MGDFFCARIAGNFVNTDVIGSLECTTKVAGARAIVVLGFPNAVPSRDRSTTSWKPHCDPCQDEAGGRCHDRSRRTQFAQQAERKQTPNLQCGR